jgi:glycosyltransferase involved in cell wall biosynthesis
MKKIFVDVTQLAHWQGRLTGIPRVMHELSARFAERPDGNYVFIMWNPRRRRFYEANIEQVLLRGKATADPVPQTVKDSRSGKTKLLVPLKMLEKRSKNVQKALYPARRTLHLMRTKSFNELHFRPKKIVMQKGDLLFVMWGEWGDKYFTRALVDLHGRGIRLQQIAHDMLPVTAPQYSGHSSSNLKRYALAIYPLCDCIVTVSQSTKHDVVSWLKQQAVTVPDIEVIRLGDDFSLTKAKTPRGKAFVRSGVHGKDFIVCVGTIEARKNHVLLYYAYKLAIEKHIQLPKIFIIGRLGWKAEDIYELITKDPAINKQMIILHNTTDEELVWLYEHCLFSIYPSMYEGWGLPVAESVSRGIPCIASNTSSIPEIAGDLLDYFSPVSSDECLRVIAHMLEPGNIKEATAKLSKYQTTSWDQTFKAVTAILDKYYGKKN